MRDIMEHEKPKMVFGALLAPGETVPKVDLHTILDHSTCTTVWSTGLYPVESTVRIADGICINPAQHLHGKSALTVHISKYRVRVLSKLGI